MRHIGRLVALVAVSTALVATGVGPAAAQDAGGDVDGDGVVDAADACPDTPVGDLIDASGCSVCPCEVTADGAAWASHDAYVACVVGEAKARKRARLIRRRSARAAIRAARRSACGDPNLTRCCVWQDLEADVGTCRLMSPDECAALDDRLSEGNGEADDDGAGSCLPNPCF